MALPQTLGGSPPRRQTCLVGGPGDGGGTPSPHPLSGPAPPASHSLPGKHIHWVVSECSCSHRPHTVPKCQGDSLLGEWLPAPSAVSWLLGLLGWERAHWWDLDLGVQDKLAGELTWGGWGLGPIGDTQGERRQEQALFRAVVQPLGGSGRPAPQWLGQRAGGWGAGQRSDRPCLGGAPSPMWKMGTATASREP